VVEVAQWLGHRPSQTLDTYAHIVAEAQDGPRLSAEEAIRRAREGSDVPYTFPAAQEAAGA
jgi:hypothetical protein